MKSVLTQEVELNLLSPGYIERAKSPWGSTGVSTEALSQQRCLQKAVFDL